MDTEGHTWQTQSCHRTSDGLVSYQRCHCGLWRVLLDEPGGVQAVTSEVAPADDVGLVRSQVRGDVFVRAAARRCTASCSRSGGWAA